MTAVQTGTEDTDAEMPAGSVAASRARQRRERRENRMGGQRLTRTGRPMRSALTRLPFVLVIIGLLGGAIVGVLWLTTMSDEAGLNASASRAAQSSLQIQIEAGNRDVASLGALPHIDAAARSMGMVPAGDVPILVIASNGAVSVIGTPSPVTAPTTAPPPSPPAPAAPATTAPATTAPATTAPATTAPVSPSAATTPVKASAASTPVASPKPSAVTKSQSGAASGSVAVASGQAPSGQAPTGQAPASKTPSAPSSPAKASVTTAPTTAKASR